MVLGVMLSGMDVASEFVSAESSQWFMIQRMIVGILGVALAVAAIGGIVVVLSLLYHRRLPAIESWMVVVVVALMVGLVASVAGLGTSVATMFSSQAAVGENVQIIGEAVAHIYGVDAQLQLPIQAPAPGPNGSWSATITAVDSDPRFCTVSTGSVPSETIVTCAGGELPRLITASDR